MLKKTLAIVLSLFLLTTGAASAATLTKSEKVDVIPTFEVKPEEAEKLYADSDEVRVVVELTEKPAIDYATEKGVSYKNLSKSTKKDLHNKAKKSRDNVKTKIKDKKVSIKYLEDFTTVANGFSAKVEYGDIEEIQSISGVSKVYIATQYEKPKEEPEMLYSKELIQAQEAWRDYGYTGEGMVIGIIDSGIDPSHKDMVLSEDTEEKLTKSSVENVIGENSLVGKFYTEKVPYGYNYMDVNDTIVDADEASHGMHVSGTAGANGDEENGGIKGVAPEAQLLGLKVFSNDPTNPYTYGDIYIKAIDDAIILGADVLNMSLGATAGFVEADAPEQQAIKRATENGIMMAISAGNSAHLGYGYANPWAANPDYGVVGSPGVTYESLQVASLENSYLNLEAATFDLVGEELLAGFMSASSVHPTSLEKKPYEVVDVGLGKPEEIAGKDLNGKFALIVRGELTFIEKTMNAQNAGAAGVIIYNNTSGYISMATESTITIPQLSLSQSDGLAIKQALENGTVTVSFEGKSQTAPNPEAGKMSSFTSWGITPNLDFKPEITAPGGNIYSTFNNDKYGMMSGTSMAAPHVAGGSALVLQRIDEEFAQTGYDRMLFAKNLMMNTAKPVLDQGLVNSNFGWNLPYSPRRQGAGIMQLNDALKTPVVVTEKTTNEAKVALKEVGDTFSFTLVAENTSDEAVTYNVGADLQTDFAGWGEVGYNVNEIEAQRILDATITVNGSGNHEVTVPANDSVEIVVEADVTNAKVDDPSLTGAWGIPVDINQVFPNGYYVEGYVTLTETTDTYPSLSVPYVGFKGDWNAAPIIDAYAGSADSFYQFTGLLNSNLEYLGLDEFNNTITQEGIAISPNGDGIHDAAVPVFSLLRNASNIQFNILDEKGKLIKTLSSIDDLRKNYYYSGSSAMYYLGEATEQWNGKIGKKVKEGSYIYEIKATLDYAGATPQSFKIPVKVDLKKPKVDASYKENTLKIDAKDPNKGSGVAKLKVLVDGAETATLTPDQTSYEFETPLEKNQTVKVVAVDYAGNEAVKTVKIKEPKKDKPGKPNKPGKQEQLN